MGAGRRLLPLAAVLAAPALAQYPTLEALLPRGGQRGTEVEVVLRGKMLAGARALVVDPGGVEVRALETREDGALAARLALAPDAELGPRAVWVRTATGLSNLCTFQVGALPEVEEVEPNGTPDEAQAVELPCTVNGVADDEDVDLFVFEGRAGQRVSIELEGQRLGDRLFDPAVTLLDGRGFALASSDDSALGRQDPMLSVALPADGPYTIQVRESAYRGAADCRYRLHLGGFARPAATLPLGGRPGEVLALRLLDGDGPAGETTVLVPGARARGGWVPPGVVPVPVRVAGDEAPSPVWLRSVALENVVEIGEEGGTPTPFTPPAALNGVLGAENEEDRYAFTGKKGDELVANVYARRLRTPVDSVILLREADGKYIAGNDDDGGRPDSRLAFELPHDGEFLLGVRDHLGRGGPEFAYRVEVTAPRPILSVGVADERPHVAVPRGGRALVDLTFEREGFDGPLRVELADLPPGVTLTVPEIPAGIGRMPALLTADEHAPALHALSRVQARALDTPSTVTGDLRVDVELVLGRNNVVFWAHTLDRLPVAVCDPAPWRVELEPPAVPLLRSGAMTLVARVVRDDGFDGEVRLSFPFLPPGVNAVRQVKVAPGVDRAELRLSARGNARLGDWPLVVSAEAETPGGRVAVASGFVTLEVVERFLEFSAQPVALERGSETELFVEVRRLQGCPGAARIELVGLPHDVAAEPVALDAESPSFLVPLRAGGESPVGKHKSHQFRATFELPGGSVVQGLAAAELRVQEPAAPVAADERAAKPVEAAASAPKPERPPTRLEKLRAEHAARLAAEGGTR